MAHSKAFSSNPGSRFRKFGTLAAQIQRVGSKKLLSNIAPTMPVFQRKIDKAEQGSQTGGRVEHLVGRITVKMGCPTLGSKQRILYLG